VFAICTLLATGAFHIDFLSADLASASAVPHRRFYIGGGIETDWRYFDVTLSIIWR
jgi:hypothetical protein